MKRCNKQAEKFTTLSSLYEYCDKTGEQLGLIRMVTAGNRTTDLQDLTLGLQNILSVTTNRLSQEQTHSSHKQAPQGTDTRSGNHAHHSKSKFHFNWQIKIQTNSFKAKGSNCVLLIVRPFCLEADKTYYRKSKWQICDITLQTLLGRVTGSNVCTTNQAPSPTLVTTYENRACWVDHVSSALWFGVTAVDCGQQQLPL